MILLLPGKTQTKKPVAIKKTIIAAYPIMELR